MVHMYSVAIKQKLYRAIVEGWASMASGRRTSWCPLSKTASKTGTRAGSKSRRHGASAKPKGKTTR